MRNRFHHITGAMTVLSLVVCLSGCLGHLQKKIIFPGKRDVVSSPGDVGLEFDDVNLTVGRYTTRGWYVPLEGARGIVLYSHGNGGNISYQLDSIVQLRSFGLSVFAYDYGGYGDSTGRPSEARCYADVHAAWNYITKDLGYAPDKVVLFGRSLGGGPTVELAQSTKPAAVVLESTFLSIGDVARATKLKPLSGLVRHRFRNKDKVAAIRSPMLIIHSPNDDVVPFHHGEALYSLAEGPKNFLAVNGGHNSTHIAMDPGYRPAWEALLTPLLGRNPMLDSI